MNPAHLHLIANHVPVFAAALAIPLLGVSLWRRDESGTFLTAVLFLVIAGVGAIVAQRSGHAAEEIVEELPGIEERLIEEHEERAEVAVWLSRAPRSESRLWRWSGGGGPSRSGARSCYSSLPSSPRG